ncbi:MAG: PAS domain S-box [Bacteroidetes bacterium]|nr:MAG: PAS domain S-box [Bacteroidota bacterium]
MINKSALYSIALSIGSSEDFKKSIEIFIASLVKNQLAPQVNFWIQKVALLPSLEGIAGHAELYVSYPEQGKLLNSFNANRLFDKLSEEGFIAEPSVELFPVIDQQAKTKYFLLSLGNAGFIELIFDKSSKGVFGLNSIFNKNDYLEFSPVLDKFSNQLRRDADVYDRALQREKSKESRSALGNLLIRKDFQRRIVATLSHEFRNPLNIIMGYLDLLSETKLSKEQKEYLEIITDTSQGLYYTVKKVFQFTNLTLDQNVFDTSSFNLIQLFDQLEKIMAHQVAKKRLSLNFSVDNHLKSWLLGDVSKLSDVLIYLLDNAIKFTAKGEVHVHVKVLADTDDTVALQFEVTDTGKGIEEKHFDQIFEFFGQEDDSITRHYGGLGLGLSIANEFITRMGGAFELFSKKEEGTKVVFRIPFRKDRHKKDLIWNKHLETDEKLTAGIKVLLVDDDPYQRDMGSKILKGWNLSIAENGYDAIQFLRENTDTQIVLMDIRMPVLDGISATRIIREELKSKAIIVAVSGEVQETTIEECLNAGMDAFVPKPYDKDNLIQTIIEKLKRPELVAQEREVVKPTDLSGMKALIVEDNKMIQLLTIRHMKDAACKFDLAQDGESALEFFSSNTYDFVLLDLYLPDIEGFELALKMREINKNSCIIAYSADDSDETREACKKAMIDGLILKNYQKTEELVVSIHQMMEERGLKSNMSEALSEQAYDLTILRKMIGDNTDDLKDIIHSFVSYSTQMMGTLESAIEQEDRSSLRKIAHSMKSSARQFQMITAADLLERIEYENEKLELEQLKIMVTQVVSIFKDVINHMRSSGLN